MADFFKRHGARLKALALILMLIIPFMLYQAAMHGSLVHTNFFFGAYDGQHAVCYEKRIISN